MLNPVDDNPQRITKELREQAEKYKWDGITFPTKVKDIHIFFREKNNNININVFGYDDEAKKIYTIRIAELKDPLKTINLFLHDDNHYCVVKDLSKLVSSQLSKKDHGKDICLRCLNAFGRLTKEEKKLKKKSLLEIHEELCSDQKLQHSIYPKPGGTAKFKNYERLHDVPFAVYADFESFIEPVQYAEQDPSKSFTNKYQNHIPSGFCYVIKCMDESVYSTKTVLKTASYGGEDMGKAFVDSLTEDLKPVYEILKNSRPMMMSDSEKSKHEKTKECYACKDVFGTMRTNEKTKKKEKVTKCRDHCHITGKYRGAACDKCNLRMRVPKFVPVLFHNLEGYVSHLFVKSLGLTDGDTKCIPKTDEKYISFGKNIPMDDGKEKTAYLEMRFLDSLKFMRGSLDSLAKTLGKDQFKTLTSQMLPQIPKKHDRIESLNLLKQKGVFPYQYMTDFSKLNATNLPSKDAFYSQLSGSGISDEDYVHAQKVWKAFNCETMKDYHDLYLKTDVLLLADIMTEFRRVCKEVYELDALHYYTAPGLAWDAMLKITEVEIDLISDPDMYLMVEKGIRGGISTITKRYAKANNKYIKDYDKGQMSVYIPYLDTNNLYGWAMRHKLPVKDFRWMSEDELENWESKPCIFEVDLEYPKELHDFHSEYPLAPEQLQIDKKLVPNLYDNKKYVLHYENLKLYLRLGLRLTKIHRGITFAEEDFMKKYIDLNTELRMKGTTDFEKDFFKLMNNSVFGKMMENVRNRINVKLVINERACNKLAKKSNF